MTSHIHIRRITVQAFRAFRDLQSTAELPTSGLVGIRGHNRDSGGSSGAGKTSVALAIAYAFGFLPFTAAAQQSWATKTPMQVELELDTHRGPAILRRGKEFSLTVGGVTTKGSAKAVEDAIRELTGLPTNLLEALTYRQQQKRGRFLSMRDSEKKEFLGVLLGAHELEEQISESVKKSNKLQVTADQLQASLETALRFFTKPEPPTPLDTAAEQMRLQELEPHLHDVTVRLQAARAEYERVAAEKQAAQNAIIVNPFIAPASKVPELKEQMEECNRRIVAQVDIIDAERKRLRGEAQRKSDEASAIFAKAAERQGIEAQISGIEEEIRNLKKSKCPTCMREWDDAERKLQDAEIVLRRAHERIEKCKAFHDEATEVRLEAQSLWDQSGAVRSNNTVIDKLVQIRSKFEREIETEAKTIEDAKRIHEAEQAAERSRVAANFSERLQTITAAIQAIQAEKSRIDVSRGDLQARIDAAARNNAHIQSVYAAALAMYARQEQEVESLREKVADTQRLADEEADYADSVKKYLGSLFDEVLEQISAETNELLRNIPNTPTTTVVFASETQTQKGTTKQEIKPVVIKNGQQIDLASGVSGGQLESVELAVDLSIAKVIGQRTGVRPGFMIFDESFAAHCLPVKEACLQVLAKAAEDSMILVVDHATELREYFSSFIDVESVDDVSRFVEQV